MVRLVVCIVFAFFSTIAKAQIFIDEVFTDWSPSYLKADAPGNNISGNIDIQKLWITDDDKYLYIRLDLDQEIKLQETNKLGIQLDIDNNVNTGFKTNGIGAEISIYFGDRDIFLNVGNTNQIITHEKIGLVALPSVSASKFELRLKKQITINGVNVNISNTIALVAVDRIANGDKIPSTNTGLKYQMTNAFTSGAKNYSFQKTQSDHLRVMSYNTELDGLFDAVRGPIQQKLIKAANPDVICLQEVYDHSVQEVIAVMNSTIPLPNNKSWQGFKTNPDEITLTRYKADAYESLNGNNISLLTVEASGSKPLVIFNNHLPCCEKDDERQNEIDALLKRHRDMKANGGNTFAYAKNTPTIILGDMNMVGLSQQQKSLLTGDIFNESAYGSDYKMDWDNTDMEDAKPFVPNTPIAYTWYSLGSGYVPGRLDYMLYTGSVMTLKNSFVLETSTIDATTLQTNNLEPDDSHNAADHLPVIADFLMGKEALTLSWQTPRKPVCPIDSYDISLQASNGTKPYSYAVNGSAYQSDSIFRELEVNRSYKFTVKDASGLTVSTDSIFLKGIPPYVINYSINDDTLTWSISGATPPYYYSLNNDTYLPFAPQIFFPISQTYLVLYKDSIGCGDGFYISAMIDKDNDFVNNDFDCNDFDPKIYPGAVEIIGNMIDEDCANGDLTLLTATAVVGDSIKCFGGYTSIYVSATGGLRPYYYASNDNVYYADSLFYVGAGLYSIKVKDASGQIFDTGIRTISQPDQLKAKTILNNSKATFLVEGGVPPYLMSINGGNFVSISEVQLEINKAYEVEFKDKNDCTTKITLEPITSLDENIIYNKYKVYPNPVTNFINIEGDDSIDNITLYNLSGNKVRHSYKPTFDMSDLPNGGYIISIKGKNGSIEFHTIIKE
jgi:endonuclease/exonuclease/phosphatase family metal-dependent hydrolase